MNETRHARPGGADGLSLVETLISTTLFGFGVLAVAAGIIAALHAGTHAAEQTQALALASQKLEELKTLPVTEVESEPAVPLDSDGWPGDGPYRRWVDVADQVEGQHTKGVTVTVEYRSGVGGKRTVDLYTILFEDE